MAATGCDGMRWVADGSAVASRWAGDGGAAGVPWARWGSDGLPNGGDGLAMANAVRVQAIVRAVWT